MAKQAVILLSGGLDSATTAAIAKHDGYELIALSINYGQKHIIELESAKKLADFLEVKEHLVFDLDMSKFGGSALTDDSFEVPKGRSDNEISHGIPITYVPARNLVFLSLAVSLAEARGITDIFIGANEVDFSGYPDCRPDFMQSFEKTANLGTKVGVEEGQIKIHTPLMLLKKSEIIVKAVELGINVSETHSCYDPYNGAACGVCDSCQLRKKGFEEAKVADNTKYVIG